MSRYPWTKRIKHPSDVLVAPQVRCGGYFNIDVDGRRFSSDRHPEPNACIGSLTIPQTGDIIKGRVVRFCKLRSFVEIEEGGIEGSVMCPKLERLRREACYREDRAGAAVQDTSSLIRHRRK